MSAIIDYFSPTTNQQLVYHRLGNAALDSCCIESIRIPDRKL